MYEELEAPKSDEEVSAKDLLQNIEQEAVEKNLELVKISSSIEEAKSVQGV